MVEKITINSAFVTTQDVPETIFGANAVYQTNTNGGDATATYESSLKALEIKHIRFPGGRGDHADASLEGSEWLNIAKMNNGELRNEVRDFLNWCSEESIKATLVLPTKFLNAAQYHGFCNEIEDFVATVLSLYPEVIDAFEIGNEYWEMGETAYAAKANIAISAIAKGIERTKVDGGDHPLILVQMATPNVGSEFHINAPGMEAIPYTQRLDLANEKIIDGLSEVNKSLIGGVVEHYYYSRDRIEFLDHNDETNYIGRDFEAWEKATSEPLELHITEWNLKTTNLAENGIRSASTIIHQFESMVDLGTDAASIWAVQHNTTTDLTGNDGDGVKQDDSGNIVSTIRGAVFDMLRDSAEGLSKVDLAIEGETSGCNLSAFGDDQNLVLYVASRSLQSEKIEFAFGDELDEYEFLSGKKLSYDPSSSDGRHYDPKQGKTVGANGLDLDRDGVVDYFSNEHDVQALFRNYSAEDLSSENNVSFSLKPFEVMQLNFQVQVRQVPNEIIGGLTSDDIYGEKGNDLIRAGGGADKVIAKAGDDTVKAGTGGDEIYGGRGEDKIFGQPGGDILKGGIGHDWLIGQKGGDLLLGNRGDDILKGGKGTDVLNGGAGDDILTGDAGKDVFIFNGGNDKIIDFSINETIYIDLSEEQLRDSLSETLSGVSTTENGILLSFNAEDSIELFGIKSLEELAAAVSLGPFSA